MNQISENERIYIYELLNGGTSYKGVGSYSWLRFMFFWYIYEQPNYEAYGIPMYETFKLSSLRASTLLGTMTKEGWVNCLQKDKGIYWRLSEDIINKMKYILDVGYLPPIDIEAILSEYVYCDKDFDIEKIKSDKKELIKYLKNAMKLESILLSYKRRYDSLYKLRINSVKNGLGEMAKFKSIMEEKILTKQEELEQIKKNVPRKPVLKSTYIELDINEPCKPELKVLRPVEPLYEKPGLFNKRKVEENNMQLKLDYERKLQFYEKAYIEYQNEYQLYINKTNEYQQKLQEQQKKVDEENQKAFETELQKYDEAMQIYSNTLEQKNAELKQLSANSEQNLNELLSNSDSWLTRQQIEFEMQFIIESIREVAKSLQQLYSYGVIYGKYRNYVALATFYDYLMSGRCETLEGANGAYNLFEQESMANTIICRLDKIISSLEQIRQTQYSIYTEIKEANQHLSKIENQLVLNNKLQNESLTQLKEICKNTEGITEQLQEISFNTEVTAFYSKQTKGLMDALGYMIALK